MKPTRTVSRRLVLALCGASVSAVLAGCGGRSGGKAEYGKRETVGDLPTVSANASNASAARAAAARAERNANPYAVTLGALRLKSHELVVKGDYRGVVIEGTVANTGHQRVEYAEVRARIYDTDGDQLGRYLDTTNDLAAGETWRFEVIVLEAPGNIGSYDMAVLGSHG